MTISVRLENRADAWPVQVGFPNAELLSQTTQDRTSVTGAQLPIDELAFRIFAAFRAHPHVNNVLTHISRANWVQVEQALNSILDPTTVGEDLSPLARNIIDLMCAERGITGKILKPYFHAALDRVLGPERAVRLIRHIQALFIEIECKADHPAPAPNEPEGDRS